MTMQFIATAAPSGTNQVTFGGLPQTFTHLQLRVFGRGTTSFADGLTLYLRFNSDSATNYAHHQLFGNGTSAFSTGNINTNNMDASQVFADSSASSNIYGVTITDILDYANTSKNKVIRTIGGWDGNSTRGRATLASGLWRNTNAITSIDAIIDGGWVSGSRLDLYGITTSEVTGA